MNDGQEGSVPALAYQMGVLEMRTEISVGKEGGGRAQVAKATDRLRWRRRPLRLPPMRNLHLKMDKDVLQLYKL